MSSWDKKLNSEPKVETRYSSAPNCTNAMCLLHNSQFVHKDICFWRCERSNLKYARQKAIQRKTIHSFSVE